jgi:hypothetical protein
MDGPQVLIKLRPSVDSCHTKVTGSREHVGVAGSREPRDPGVEGAPLKDHVGVAPA